MQVFKTISSCLPRTIIPGPILGPGKSALLGGLFLAFLSVTPASAGNEDFAPGNCTSPGRSWSSVISILKFQKYLPTTAVVAPETGKALELGIATGPAGAKLPSKTEFEALLAQTQDALSEQPVPDSVAHFIHPEGISLTVSETRNEVNGLLHVKRQCLFYLTPQAYKTTSLFTFTNFGPIGISTQKQRANVGFGKMEAKYFVAEGTPEPTESTGKGGRGGHLWLVGLHVSDDLKLPNESWVPGSFLMFMEFSDYRRPEEYRIE